MKTTENDISTAAATLGRKGGSVKSEAKAAACKENGKKGGRPRKPVKEGYRGQCNKCGLVGDWNEYEDGTWTQKCEHCGSTRGWVAMR